MYTLTEINVALAETLAKVAQFIQANSVESLYAKPGEKWSIAEELSHLTKANQNSVLAFGQSPEQLRQTQHTPRGYNELVSEYKEKYAAQGVQMPVRLIPEELQARHTVSEVLALFDKAAGELQQSVSNWSEETLDGVTVWKHPLLGPVTAREMLFFTIFHNRHHLASMQQKLAAL